MKKYSLTDSRSVICVVVMGSSLLISLLFLAVQIRLMRVPVLRDYGEGHTFWMSQQIANLAVAYKPLDGLPYVIFPYTPLYLIVSKLTAFVTGDLLMAGRAVSLFSTLGLAAIIGMLVFQCVSGSFPRIWRWGIAALGAAMVFTTGSVIGWASLMRVDMLGLMLMYAGMAVYILRGHKQSGQYLAVTLFVLAVFTKQTLLSAPLACAIFGLFAYPKTTMKAYVLAVVLGLSGLGICYWLTDGGFLKNVLSYNLNPFSWTIVVAQFKSHLRLNIGLKLMLSAAVLFALYNPKGVRRSGVRGFVLAKSKSAYARAVMIGSVNAFFAGLLAISIGKMGSIYNFFLALDISLCLLAALCLFRLLATWRLYERPTRGRPYILLFLVVLLFIPSRWVLSAVTEDFTRQIKEEAQLVTLLRQTRGPILSDNMLLITKAGHRIEAEPATLSFLTMAGGWDETPYLQLFEHGYFSLVVTTPLLNADRYSPAVISSVKRNYYQAGQIGNYLVFRPKNRQDHATGIHNRR